MIFVYVLVSVSVLVLRLIVMGGVGEAALGAVFGELLSAVLRAKDKVVMFKESLDNLESTLKSIDPVIRKIEQHNNKLERPKEELESLKTKMEKGAKLVCKCSEIHKLDFVSKIRYQGKLEALKDSLMRFFDIELPAQMARDLKETLRKVRRKENAVKKLPFNSVDESNPNPAGEVIESEINVESDYDDAVSVDSAPIHENGSDTISISDEQEVKTNEGMDSSFIQEEPSSMTTVIAPQYCDPLPIFLEIVRTVKTFGSDTFSVANVNNDILFNLEKPSFSIHERHTLIDDHKNPIVTLHKKKMTAHNRWQVFRGKSDQADDLIFNIKEHHIIQLKPKLDVFLAKNTEENVYDFRVEGSYFSGGSYVVYAAPSNNIIAQISKYIARGRIGASKESAVIRVKANVDSTFIVALTIVILSIA